MPSILARSRRSLARLGLAAALALGSPSTTAPADVAMAATSVDTTWQACGDGFDCTGVTVPWDHDDPLAGSLEIPVTRHPATGPGDRLGTIVFNPGGPGVPGKALLMALIDAFPASLRERFDLVSFDPRGTGGAERVDCGTDVAALFALDQTAGPGGPAASAWADMATACSEALGDRLGHISTAATARDIDLIRQALGEEVISWYGTSYGTRLGAEYLRRSPDRVRAMVLDGAMDPSAPLDQQARDMAAAAEPGLLRLLEACAHVDPCPLGSDPVGVYDALAASLATEPLTTSDGHEVGVVALQSAALSASNLPNFFGQAFVEALAAAQSGQGDGLLAMGPGSFTDLAGQGTFDAYWTILCNDEPSHPDPTASAELAQTLADAAPRLGLAVAATFGVGCQGWPEPGAPVQPIAIEVPVPVLVVGSTGDPSTAYAWSQRMADAIEGAGLLTRKGDGHTAFYSTFLRGCTGAAVADFLIDPTSAAALTATCSD